MKLLRRRISASIFRSPFMVLTTLALGTLFALALTACGSDDEKSPSGSNSVAATQAPNVTGTVTIEGSSTVQPYTIALIDEFAKTYPDVKINPPSGKGSGAGITAFINKQVDIAQSSRAMKDDEKDRKSVVEGRRVEDGGG